MKVLSSEEKRYLVDVLQAQIFELENRAPDTNHARLTLVKGLYSEFKQYNMEVVLQVPPIHVGTNELRVTDHGPRKISVIKAIRSAIPGYGLADAKFASENSRPVLTGTSSELANRVRMILEAEGATCTVFGNDVCDMVCNYNPESEM